MPTIDKLRTGIRQFETTRGRRIDPSVLEALLAAELDVQASRESEARELELREREEKRLEEAQKASGKAQVAGTAITGALLLKDTKLGKAISEPVVSAVKTGAEKVGGLFAGETAAETLTPAVSEAITPAVTDVATVATTGEIAAPAVTAETTAPAVTGTATAATPGSLAVPSLAGAGVGRLGANLLFPGSSTAEDIGTIGGGALTGWYLGAQAGSVGGPVGAVIGGLVGVAVDVVSDASVICTELNRQGYIDDETLRLDHLHCQQNIDQNTYNGYRLWADVLVKKMKKYKIITQLIRPFACSWANEMASRMDTSRKGNILGKLLLLIGVPICRKLGKKQGVQYA